MSATATFFSSALLLFVHVSPDEAFTNVVVLVNKDAADVVATTASSGTRLSAFPSADRLRYDPFYLVGPASRHYLVRRKKFWLRISSNSRYAFSRLRIQSWLLVPFHPGINRQCVVFMEVFLRPLCVLSDAPKNDPEFIDLISYRCSCEAKFSDAPKASYVITTCAIWILVLMHLVKNDAAPGDLQQLLEILVLVAVLREDTS